MAEETPLTHPHFKVGSRVKRGAKNGQVISIHATRSTALVHWGAHDFSDEPLDKLELAPASAAAEYLNRSRSFKV